MGTKETTGTTLEILAPYLAYDPTLQHDSGKNYTIARLRLDGEVEVWEVATNPNAEPQEAQIGDLSEFLPVLYAFEDLVKPLEDGTVPAVEVAGIIAGKTDWKVLEFNRSRVIVLQDRNDFECIIKHMIDPDCGWTFDVYSGKAHQQLLDVCGAYDYLRSKHFAVNLEPHQYVRK